MVFRSCFGSLFLIILNMIKAKFMVTDLFTFFVINLFNSS